MQQAATSVVPAAPEPLPEKEFQIQGDNCAQYVLPLGQSVPLVYEQEVIVDAETKEGRAAYTDRLKLPVYCLKCLAAAEVQHFAPPF